MKVHIVDDASFIRIICRYHLEKAGYQVVGESYDGSRASEEIQQAQPDCVIMDLALPNKNGIEVMKEINEQFPHIKFLVVSALDKKILESTGTQQAKYEYFIAKPFEGDELIEKIGLIRDSLRERKHG